MLHQGLIAAPGVKLQHEFWRSHSNPLTCPHSESLVSGPQPETAPRLELPGFRGLERSAVLCKHPSSGRLAGREPGVAFGRKRASVWVRRLIQRKPDFSMQVMVLSLKHAWKRADGFLPPPPSPPPLHWNCLPFPSSHFLPAVLIWVSRQAYCVFLVEILRQR